VQVGLILQRILEMCEVASSQRCAHALILAAMVFYGAIFTGHWLALAGLAWWLG
jgi:hypothetical protein